MPTSIAGTRIAGAAVAGNGGRAAARLTRRSFLQRGLAGGALLVAGCAPRPPVVRPNVFLITVDTLRADHLGCYGYPRDTSPFIDRLAGESLRFEHCFAHAPNTWTSVASLLSGFWPHETRVLHDVPLPESLPTLPGLLRRHGYTNLAVVSNFVLRKGQGYERGFDVYDDSMLQSEGGRDLAEKIGGDATDQAIALLERAPRENLFLWVHYQDPHGPYTPPPEYRDLFRNRGASSSSRASRELPLNRVNSAWGGIPKYQRLGEHRQFDYYVSQYDAEIRYVDEQIRRLVDAISAMGLYDDGLLVLTADHGEGMGEHDYYFGHGENLYSTLTRVPLLARLGDGATGRRDDVVQHIDVVPTLQRCLGLEVDPRLRGRDLRAAVRQPREVYGAMLSVGARDDYESFLVYDGMKLIDQPPVPGLERKRHRLFDLRSDPGETRDLAEAPAHAPQLAELRSRLAAVRGEDRLGIDRSLFEGHRELTPQETEILRSLGYIE